MIWIFQPLYIVCKILLYLTSSSLIIFLLEIIRKLKYSTMYNIFFINFEFLKLRFQDNNRVELFFSILGCKSKGFFFEDS